MFNNKDYMDIELNTELIIKLLQDSENKKKNNKRLSKKHLLETLNDLDPSYVRLCETYLDNFNSVLDCIKFKKIYLFIKAYKLKYNIKTQISRDIIICLCAIC